MTPLAAQLAESVRVAIHQQLDDVCWCNDWPRYVLTEEGERVAERYEEREREER